MAFLTKDLKIMLNDEREDKEKVKTFHMKVVLRVC